MRSDGIIGLYRALERFDPTREGSFPQYAAYWIRNEIAAGALRSRAVSFTGHSQRKARKDEADCVEGESHLPRSELQLLSLDASGMAVDSEEEAATLHEVFPDPAALPRISEGNELKREWLEILRDCPTSWRPFLLLRYYYPVWQVEAEGALRGPEVFDALALMARERLAAGAMAQARGTLTKGVVSPPRNERGS
ncbi:MAG: sigma factor [Candidatus Methylacidiphilaceae bacterium]